MKQIHGEMIAPHVDTDHAVRIGIMSNFGRCGMFDAIDVARSGWSDRWHTYLPQHGGAQHRHRA